MPTLHEKAEKYFSSPLPSPTPQLTGHISQQFDQQLQHLHQRTLEMGGLVEEQTTLALMALLHQDTQLAEQVISRNRRVNAYEISLDEICVNLLVRQRPAGLDLRFVKATIKTVTDLERIGDEAKSMAYQAIALEQQENYLRYLPQLETLGWQTRHNLHETLNAFARLDLNAAEAVYAKAHVLKEDTFLRLSGQVLQYMFDDAQAIPHVLEMLWAGRALERISERSCNICNYVSYCVSGKIRHTH